MGDQHFVRLPLAYFVPVLVLTGISTVAQAQVVPSRPELEGPAVTAPMPSGKVRIDAAKALQTEDCPLASYKLDIKIGKIEFTAPGGAELPAQIRALLSGEASTPPSGTNQLAVVCQLRDRASEILRTRGYIASVQIPPQRVEDGTLRLEVVTARLVEVRVRGDAGPYRGTLAARIKQLQALDPLNAKDAERILLLADDIPGLDVRLALRPAGTAPGAVVGELTVSVSRWRALMSARNYGSRQLGRESVFARAEFYGLTGLSDMTFIGAQTTADLKEQKVVQAGHTMGLGSRGATLSVSGVYAWSRPDIGTLDLRSQSVIGNVELAAPLFRSVQDRVDLAGGFEVAEQRVRVYGTGASAPLNRDRLRTLYARLSGGTRGLRIDGSQTYGVSGSVEVRKGLDIFAATRPRSVVAGYTPSRFEGDAQAWVLRGDMDAEASLVPLVSLAGTVQAQWADRPLLNFDEYSIGNFTIGRGYDPGANSADRAIGLRGELRLHPLRNERRIVDLFGFYDSVWIWNLDTGAIENNRRLGSFGGGVRLQIPRLLSLETSYARPQNAALLVPGAKRAPARLLLSLTLQFQPR